jgi:hypothetical protein
MPNLPERHQADVRTNVQTTSRFAANDFQPASLTPVKRAAALTAVNDDAASLALNRTTS